MKGIAIEPDITKASTLGSEFYTDERYFEISKEKIFARSWQFLGKLSDFSPVQPVAFLEGFLDEPLLITQENGSAYCLSNVCTHRGKIVVEKACDARGLRCGYHGRKFDLSGKFLSMPEFEEAENFPTVEDDLRRVPMHLWNGFAFVSLAPEDSPLEVLQSMTAAAGLFDSSKLEFAGSRDYRVDAHWALYCENYLEGFHIPFVHRSLNETIDFSSYKTLLFELSSLQIVKSRNQEDAFRSEIKIDDEHFSPNSIAALYFFIFPNMMFNFYPWGISVNTVQPVRSDLTNVRYFTYITDRTRMGTGAGAELDTVELEDQAVVESVQKGIRSRYYDRGRYSPKQERGTHHFHRLISKFISV